MAWRNSKHRAQWDSTLSTYAHPTIGSLPIASVDTATEMALHVLAYNLTRVMNIIGIQPLMAAMRA